MATAQKIMKTIPEVKTLTGVTLTLTPAEATMLASLVGQISGGMEPSGPGHLVDSIYQALYNTGVGMPYRDHGRAVTIRMDSSNRPSVNWSE